jgi:SagB-type dehydrogenase family enzyme
VAYSASRDEVEKQVEAAGYLRASGAFAMQHTMLSMYADTTLVRTPEVVTRGRWQHGQEGFLGERLLLNFRPDNRNLGFQLGVGRAFEPDAVTNTCHPELGEELAGAVPLPTPKRLKAALSAVVTSRRSARDFRGAELSIPDVSTLLFHAAGVSGHLETNNPTDPGGKVPVRNAPSGGGLYPIALHLLAVNVRGLDRAAYRYQPISHTLRPGPAFDEQALVRLAASPDFDIRRTALCLVYEYRLYVNSRKYGDAGLVYGLIEVGAIAQNVHLTRTALGLVGCDQGGYHKQDLERFLGLDGHSRHVVHFTAIGG